MKCKGGAIRVACDNVCKDRVLNPERDSNVDERCSAAVGIPSVPSSSFIMRDGNFWMAVAIDKPVINGAISRDANRWIALARRSAGNRSNRPVNAIVG